jgi:predicted acylesterase/phospholipase RssA
MPAGKQHTTLGLACAGGVVEGAIYEIGALCALEDAIDGLDFTNADIYVGVSSGALIASVLANGITARTLSDALLSRADPLLNIDPDVLFTPAVGEYVRRLAQLPGAARRAVVNYLKNPLDLSIFGTLMSLGSAVPVGVFDNAHIEQYLAEAFSIENRTNDFSELRASLRVVAVNLDTSEVVTFGDRATRHIPISRAVQASTALPILYCPVEIDGEYYIDGVARRTVHASRALEAGADLTFCINPIVPINVRGAKNEYVEHSLVELGLPAVLSQTFRTIIHSRRKAGFRNYDYAYPNADVIVVEPELTDYDVFFSNIFSFSKRRIICEHAYAATLRYLRRNLDEMTPVLERHGFRLRMEVIWDDKRTLFDDTGLHHRPERLDGRAHRRGAINQANAQLNSTLERLNAVLERIEHEVDGQNETLPVLTS